MIMENILEHQLDLLKSLAKYNKNLWVNYEKKAPKKNLAMYLLSNDSQISVNDFMQFKILSLILPSFHTIADAHNWKRNLQHAISLIETQIDMVVRAKNQSVDGEMTYEDMSVMYKCNNTTITLHIFKGYEAPYLISIPYKEMGIATKFHFMGSDYETKRHRINVIITRHAKNQK